MKIEDLKMLNKLFRGQFDITKDGTEKPWA
jgi:hypothetical protein